MEPIAETSPRNEQGLTVDGRPTSSEGLVWPAPVNEDDILWLRAEAEPTSRGPATEALFQLLDERVSIEWHDDVAVATKQSADKVVSDAARPPVSALRSDAARGPAPPLALSQLLAAGVSVEWHDAVALVSQLADEGAPDRPR